MVCRNQEVKESEESSAEQAAFAAFLLLYETWYAAALFPDVALANRDYECHRPKSATVAAPGGPIQMRSTLLGS